MCNYLISRDKFTQSFSTCGYDSHTRQKQEIAKDYSVNSKPWQRSVPYPHTGCLAHVEIMERVGDGCVTHIAGIGP